jgi:hypothetical protein
VIKKGDTKMKLYEITAETQSILDDFEQRRIEGEFEDGVFPAAMQEALNKLDGDKETKVLDIACVIKGKEASALALKAEAKKLTERAKSFDKTVDWLKEYLMSNCEAGKVLEDSRARIGWRKSVSVEITGDGWLLEDALRIEPVFKPNKATIKEWLKGQKELSFAHLETKQNIQIK